MKKANNRFNLSQRFVTVHATRCARLRMNRANSASQVKRMFDGRFALNNSYQSYIRPIIPCTTGGILNETVIH